MYEIKKDKVKVITNRDKELMQQLARTAIITREQVARFGYTEKRLANLAKDGYIKMELAKIHGKFETIYRLNTRGQTYVRTQCGNINNLYKMASPTHDCKLTELYYTRYYVYRDSWRTESDFIYEQGMRVSVDIRGIPDASINIDGQAVAIEITTNNYTQEQIEAKMDFAQNNNMEVHSYVA